MGTSTSSSIQAAPAIKFGTDGWRAVTAAEFTFANVELVTRSYARVLSEKVTPQSRVPSVVVGFDNRFLADAFAWTAASVLSELGLNVLLFSTPVPTPLLSFTVRNTCADGGIMLTASHNPANYSGFKIKDSLGCSAFDETTRAVERHLVGITAANTVNRHDLSSPPNGVRFVSAQQGQEAYKQQVRTLVDCERISRTTGTVVVDSMHGTGGRWIESFLKASDACASDVVTIRGERDSLFGGVAPEPIDKNLAPLKQAVRERRARIGLATDGDADRLGVVNELGETMTMHQVAPMLLFHLVRNKGLQGTVVATVTQSVLMRRMALALGLPFVETPVGFKYIAKLMLESDVVIGAEESGGIGIKGHLPERDGIFNGLLLLEALTAQKQTPTQFVADIQREFGNFAYLRDDLHVPIEVGRTVINQLGTNTPAQIGGKRVESVNCIDGVKLSFTDDSWLMLRQSGTEPVLRVYTEASSSADAHELLEFGRRLVAAAD